MLAAASAIVCCARLPVAHLPGQHGASLVSSPHDSSTVSAGFSIGSGIAWTLLTVQVQMLAPCNYPAEIAGNSGTSLIA